MESQGGEGKVREQTIPITKMDTDRRLQEKKRPRKIRLWLELKGMGGELSWQVYQMIVSPLGPRGGPVGVEE